jgi:hypothetical protein
LFPGQQLIFYNVCFCKKFYLPHLFLFVLAISGNVLKERNTGPQHNKHSSSLKRTGTSPKSKSQHLNYSQSNYSGITAHYFRKLVFEQRTHVNSASAVHYCSQTTELEGTTADRTALTQAKYYHTTHVVTNSEYVVQYGDTEAAGPWRGLVVQPLWAAK